MVRTGDRIRTENPAHSNSRRPQRRPRRSTVNPMTDTDPAPPPALPDPHRETLIRADIADAARQLEAGELDEETARQLTARYQAEIDSLTDASPPPPEKRPSLSRGRGLAGGGKRRPDTQWKPRPLRTLRRPQRRSRRSAVNSDDRH